MYLLELSLNQNSIVIQVFKITIEF